MAFSVIRNDHHYYFYSNLNIVIGALTHQLICVSQLILVVSQLILAVGVKCLTQSFN